MRNIDSIGEAWYIVVRMQDEGSSMTQNDALDWRKLFHEVLVETDPKKLQERIDAVEGAIFFRYQELERNPDAQSERSAIQEATQVITTLKAQKLSASRRSGVWAGAPKP